MSEILICQRESNARGCQIPDEFRGSQMPDGVKCQMKSEESNARWSQMQDGVKCQMESNARWSQMQSQMPDGVRGSQMPDGVICQMESNARESQMLEINKLWILNHLSSNDPFYEYLFLYIGKNHKRLSPHQHRLP